ncbi:MAG: NAD(P)/FAD-dependent oxidoreductase [Chthoniobacterales bacterium]
MKKTIAIIGGGPSGSALATFLVQAGHRVTLFDDGKRPNLIVGESLIPALVPILRKLGVEENVAAIGMVKPGVSFLLNHGESINFCFDPVKKCGLPTYAYNVPRAEFDRILADHAVEAGAIRIPQRVKLEITKPDHLTLDAATIAAAPSLEGKQPDLLVDATGRSRLFARSLDIPSRVGPRKDVAYFAHYENCEQEGPLGQVLIGRMKAGWSWRIPLPGRLSIGIVLNREDATQLGESAEERLANTLRTDPHLSAVTKNAIRTTEVATYSNYQLVSERTHGPGWVMAGDAFGFVDPMLSPGMYLALRSAELLAENLNDLPKYSAQIHQLLEAWIDLISYYYDGRMFAMYHTGQDIIRKYDSPITRLFNRHLESNIACMASGGTTASRYGRSLIQFMARHGIWQIDPATLAIH